MLNASKRELGQLLQRTVGLNLAIGAILWMSASLAARILQDRLSAPGATAALLLPALRSAVAPEPSERLLFLSALVLAPPLVLALVAGLSNVAARPRRWGRDRLEGWLSLLAALLLLLPLAASPAMRAVIGPAGGSKATTVIDALFSLALALALVQRHCRRGPWQRRRHQHRSNAALISALLIMLLAMLSFRVFGFGHLSGSGVWSDHLDAVVAGIAQVRAGRTLLVDAPAQYGLFPELLAPLLKGLPPGVLGLSLAFAGLQLIGMLTLMVWLYRRLHSAAVCWAACLALVMVSFGTHGLIGLRFSEPDPYFQYWPVRLIGPALSIPLILWMVRTLSWQRLIAVSAWIGTCLFWNLDSGVAVLYATAMLLSLLSGIAGWNRSQLNGLGWRPLLARTLALPVLSLAVLALELGLLAIKAQQWLDLGWVTSFQATFYGLGFMMLPLPAWPDAWFVVVAGYLIALVIALQHLRAGGSLRIAAPLLYLSLLGMGLFTYYQGRSHFFNLVSVSWPLVLVTALLVDRHLLALQRGVLPPRTAGLPVAGLSALLMPAIALLGGLPSLVLQASALPFNTPERSEPAAPHLASERELVRQACTDGNPPCLLVCKRQGIYALEVGTASSWRGPSPSELLLLQDRDRLVTAMLAGEPERIVLGIGPTSAIRSLNLSPLQLLKHYRLVAVNRESTLVVLDRRPRRDP